MLMDVLCCVSRVADVQVQWW